MIDIITSYSFIFHDFVTVIFEAVAFDIIKLSFVFIII
jgi:hypothetical protein